MRVKVVGLLDRRVKGSAKGLGLGAKEFRVSNV